MSAPALSQSWPVGDRYRATLIVSKPNRAGHRSAVIEWTPHLPGQLTKEEVAQYVAGRNAAFQALGLSALVIET
jgi:hypothetical protein